jgi:hypothetical protein
MPGDPLTTFIGAGVGWWKPEGGIYRDLGFMRSFVTTPAVTPKEYMQKRSGIRSPARRVTLEQRLSVTFVVDEIIAENLGLYFMGTVTPGSPYDTIQIMDLVEQRGSFQFVGDNAFGVHCQVNIPLMSVLPGGGPDWLTDDWLGLEMTAEAFRDPNTGDFGTVFAGITARVP